MANMPRFIAIPVAQGDAFYLKTAQGSVLVDGGRATLGFPELFRTYVREEGVDILVATHNDADHANGVLGFMQAGLRCGEVWLPGRWGQVLRQVLRPWERVVYLLARQAASVDEDFEASRSLLEQYAERRGHEEGPHDGEELELDESGWPVALIGRLEEGDDDEDVWVLAGWKRLLWPISSYWAGWPKQRLFLEAVLAARRIREIALEAFHRGVTVRWFEYDPRSAGGGYDWLRPLNGRQLMRVRPVKDEALLWALALTVWNKESIVYWAGPGFAAGGVLFTGDSDLGGVQLPSLRGGIVTAPHHGSEANAKVYDLIGEPVIWVRSDGKHRNRPCRGFVEAQGRRFCTLCRSSGSKKQAVQFWGRGARWVPGRGVRPCACK